MGWPRWLSPEILGSAGPSHRWITGMQRPSRAMESLARLLDLAESGPMDVPSLADVLIRSRMRSAFSGWKVLDNRTYLAGISVQSLRVTVLGDKELSRHFTVIGAPFLGALALAAFPLSAKVARIHLPVGQLPWPTSRES